MELVTGNGDCGSTGRTGFIVRGGRSRYSGGLRSRTGGNSDVGSNGFAAGLRSGRASLSRCCCGWPRRARQALIGRETRVKDIALGQPNWPTRATQIGNSFKNQFELPLLFYVLIALALPLRHADLVIVLMSWVFVVTRFAHAGIFVTSNDMQQRWLAWFAGVLVLLAMWIYFALKMLLLI